MTSGASPASTYGPRSVLLGSIVPAGRQSMPRRPPSFPRLDTRSLPGPENISRWALPNGIVLLVRQNHASPSVVLNGYLWAGALEEDGPSAGLAHFTAACLMRGTPRRSFPGLYYTS